MDLSVTFIRIAAERGNFTRDDIAEMTGRYKRQGTFNNILRESSADFDFNLTVPEVLTSINKHQPTSITELTDVLDISLNTAHDWIHQLVEEGLIQESQANHSLPANSIVYELCRDVGPSQKLPCRNPNCDRRFFNFGTRTQHREHVHED